MGKPELQSIELLPLFTDWDALKLVQYLTHLFLSYHRRALSMIYKHRCLVPTDFSLFPSPLHSSIDTGSFVSTCGVPPLIHHLTF